MAEYKWNIGVFQKDSAGTDYYWNIGASQTDAAPLSGNNIAIFFGVNFLIFLGVLIWFLTK